MLLDFAQLSRHGVVVVNVLPLFEFLRFFTLLVRSARHYRLLVDRLGLVALVERLQLTLVVEESVTSLLTEVASHNLDLNVLLVAIMNVLVDEFGRLESLVTLVAPEVLCRDFSAILLIVDIDLFFECGVLVWVLQRLRSLVYQGLGEVDVIFLKFKSDFVCKVGTGKLTGRRRHILITLERQQPFVVATDPTIEAVSEHFPQVFDEKCKTLSAMSERPREFSPILFVQHLDELLAELEIPLLSISRESRCLLLALDLLVTLDWGLLVASQLSLNVNWLGQSLVVVFNLAEPDPADSLVARHFQGLAKIDIRVACEVLDHFSSDPHGQRPKRDSQMVHVL